MTDLFIGVVSHEGSRFAVSQGPGGLAAVLAEQSVLPVRDVIAWSAPFGGSALLLWGKPLNRFPEGIIYDDFCPTSAKLAALRASMASSSVRYFGITGPRTPRQRRAPVFYRRQCCDAAPRAL